MRKVILLFILITSVLGAWADGNVTFTASAPDVVVSGDQFRLTYTVNTHKVRDFRAPNIKGFDVLMGPSRSQQRDRKSTRLSSSHKVQSRMPSSA